MKIHICSRDMGFLQSCRKMLEVWSEFACVDAELTLAEHWADLQQMPRSGQCILFLDAEHLDLSLDTQSLEETRTAYNALFVCARDSRKAIDLYRLRPTAVLDRPFSAFSLDRAMSRCVSQWQTGLQNLELTENRSRLRIPLCDIMWAEALGRCCILHCLSRDVQIGESLNELITQLPGNVFIRCQRSYLVNLHHVKSADGKVVNMTNGEAISIGRSIRPEVMSAVGQYQTRWYEQLG